MGDKTKIEWTSATWNPTTGCDRVSPGCDHCYAMTLAPRLKAMGSPRYQTDGDPKTSGPGFGIAMHPDALDQPLRWTRPRRIFVNSMSDLFHDGVTDEFIAQVFAMMLLAPDHTFQLLTKRHGRMRSLLTSRNVTMGPSGPLTFEDMVRNVAHNTANNRRSQKQRVPSPPGYADAVRWPLPNVHLGVSVEDQKRADLRIPALLATPAAVRFLSCEPLLGPVDLTPWVPPATCECGHAETEHSGLHRTYGCEGGDGSWENPICGCRKMRGEREHNMGDPYDNHGLHWVIVGGESGRGARPMHPQWARDLRDQCVKAGVPFLFKQAGNVLAREWGAKGKGTDPAEWPEPFPRDYP